jgi:hypothetical protein
MKIVARGPGFIACSSHSCSGSGEYRGKTYHWDFSDRFGPLFTTKDGGDIDPQPGIRSHAWAAFEVWLKELYGDQVITRADELKDLEGTHRFRCASLRGGTCNCKPSQIRGIE